MCKHNSTEELGFAFCPQLSKIISIHQSFVFKHIQDFEDVQVAIAEKRKRSNSQLEAGARKLDF